MKNMIRKLIFLIGFLLCASPIAINVVTQYSYNHVISEYKKAAEQTSDDSLNAYLEEAQKYNALLYDYQTNSTIDDLSVLSDQVYNSTLDVTGTGIMGSIQIPKISVDLPVAHGVGDDVLSQGIGHIQDTSLPVGGTNTHCVLSGHRGTPKAKLFLRLDELEEGDLFFIRTCNQTLAYRVCEIRVVEPDDSSVFTIQEGRDLVSLVTCTPYGLNTHRLIVTGERTDYTPEVQEEVEQERTLPSLREMATTALPFVFLLLAIIKMVMNKKRKKKGGRSDEVK